jgi:hypothetical protein
MLVLSSTCHTNLNSSDFDCWGDSDDETKWGNSKDTATSSSSSPDNRRRDSSVNTASSDVSRFSEGAGGNMSPLRRYSRKLSKSSLPPLNEQASGGRGASFRDLRRVSMEQKQQDAGDELNATLCLSRRPSKSVINLDDQPCDQDVRNLRRKSIEEKQQDEVRNDLTVRRHSGVGLASGDENNCNDAVAKALQRRKSQLSLEEKQQDAIESRRNSKNMKSSSGIDDDHDDSTFQC